ncbi:MAG: peptidyl-prolyl cis-trans isomerase [Planctomycetia bacterium]|nr:peptidyl-prolyl cis-trans isomerase [Planctomycetia bacterium]
MVRLLACALLLSAVLTASAQEKNPVVLLETSMGNIKIELFPDKAPVTVKNFLNYVDDKFYDGTVFHRVMGKENTRDQKDFMIQGGGFEPGMKQKKTKEPIKNEAGADNLRGTIAMARTSDPDSATAQFFINVADNAFLNKNNESAGYAVFGKVIEGLDVVDKIKAVKTGFKGGHANVPVDDVVIKAAKRVN